MVNAADGRVMSLSEDVEKMRLLRNRLDGKRVELQMELAGKKLKEAFGVVGEAGLRLGAGRVGAGKNAGLMRGLFVRWRLACLEERQRRVRAESEANRGKAENYEVRERVTARLRLRFVTV